MRPVIKILSRLSARTLGNYRRKHTRRGAIVVEYSGWGGFFWGRMALCMDDTSVWGGEVVCGKDLLLPMVVWVVGAAVGVVIAARAAGIVRYRVSCG